MEATFEARQAALVEIEFYAVPGIAAAEIEIAKKHTAKVSQLGNAFYAPAPQVTNPTGASKQVRQSQ